MPGVDLKVFFDGLRDSIKQAQIVGSPRIVLGSGMGFPGKKRPAQLDTLAEVFIDADKIAVEEGMQLVLEPINTRHDHPGALLDRTMEAVQIADKVNSSNFKILYDIYHSSMEGENVLDIMKQAKHQIGYVQLADTNGRHEPGTGTIDWSTVIPAVSSIAGYTGPIGLEFYPSKDTTEAIEFIRSL
jgi:hydroxypyruvate isomerase